MAEVFGFDRAGTQRVVRAVRRDEQRPPPAPRRERDTPGPSPRFWATITAEGTGVTAGWYSWKLVYRNPADATGWADAAPAVTGTTNARETNGGTAYVGARVEMEFDGYNTTAAPVYRFHAPPAGVLVKVTGSASGGGKYNGNIWKPPAADVAATGTLTEANIGAAGVPCLILNTREVGKTTHDLAASGFLPLVFPGRIVRINADLMPVVSIDGFQWENCA